MAGENGCITFVNTLGGGYRDLFRAVRRPGPVLSVFLLLHVLMPVIAMVLGNLLFPDHPLFSMGLVLEFSIPTAVATLMWAGMTGGNVSLTLSILLLDTVLAPFYHKVIPVLKEHGTKVIMDSDGNISRMIPWMQRVGIDGVLPLERQAGVDIAALREQYPDFLFIGAFDKMTMRQSTEAMKGEFQRLLPVMKTGGFIPSCDHQTPPDCPLERYRDYVSMLHEYAEKAVR